MLLPLYLRGLPDSLLRRMHAVILVLNTINHLDVLVDAAGDQSFGRWEKM